MIASERRLLHGLTLSQRAVLETGSAVTTQIMLEAVPLWCAVGIEGAILAAKKKTPSDVIAFLGLPFRSIFGGRLLLAFVSLIYLDVFCFRFFVLFNLPLALLASPLVSNLLAVLFSGRID